MPNSKHIKNSAYKYLFLFAKKQYRMIEKKQLPHPMRVVEYKRFITPNIKIPEKINLFLRIYFEKIICANIKGKIIPKYME